MYFELEFYLLEKVLVEWFYFLFEEVCVINGVMEVIYLIV